MSLLDLNLENIPEIKIHDADTEALLRVISAKVQEKKSRAGEEMIALILDDPTDELIDDIYCYLSIPSDGLQEDEPKKAAKQLARIRDFYTCFNIDPAGGVDMDKDVVGQTGTCLVGIEDDQTGQSRNNIRRFITGQ